jgi:orotate phosphoribosyltransferase
LSTTIRFKEIYPILDDLTVEVEILENPYQFRLEQLFQMAARINKKRSFLFVSKVLGKHLAVNPQIPLLVGSLLSIRYMEVVYGIKDKRAGTIAEALQTNENIDRALASIRNQPIVLPKLTTFIGFAETATALGHAVFSTFANHAKYIHTTRESINELTSIINFEEEHSHATSHRVYAHDQDFFNDQSEVILVDDEITTGKTALNIIRKIKSEYPVKKVFTVVSILDWRTTEHRERYRQLERELEITIHTVSLIDGIVSVKGEPFLEEEDILPVPSIDPEITYVPIQQLMNRDMFKYVTSTNLNGTSNSSAYLQATGRFGLSIEEDQAFSQQFQTIAKRIKEYRKGKKTLVIGTGEFMYIPMQVASFLGSNVYFQATTRSPIYQKDSTFYTIQNKFIFESPEDNDLMNYLYNIKPNEYDEIFIFIERISSLDMTDSLINALKITRIPFINVVMMSEIIES